MSDTPADSGAPETPAPAPVADTAPEQQDLAGEVAKWKSLAQKHEKTAKANVDKAKQYDQLKVESMTELERAVAEARAEAATAVRLEFGSKLVDAEVRAATAGRGVDVDALLETLDRGRFVGDDGEIDRDAISGWVDRVAPKVEEKDESALPTFPDLSQGFRGPSVPALNSDPLLSDLKSALHIS